MASPRAMTTGRPRRAAASRGARRQEDEEERQLREELGEDSEQEEAPRGRRPGKEPVGEDEEDYAPDADDEEAQEQQQQQLTGRRRGRSAAGGGDEAGPSKRGRRGGVAVKQEPGGEPAEPSRRGGAAAAAAAAADARPRPTAGELRAVDEKIAEYRRVRDREADKAEGKVSRLALDQASRAVVRHMLFAHSEKPGVPVKRAEVAAVVTARFPNLKSKAVVTNYVIAHAAHHLVEDMGLEMASVPKLAARGRGADGPEEGGQQYVLRSIVPPSLFTAYVQEPRGASQRALLMLVLALIQLAGGKLGEEDLWAQLGEVGIDREAPHPSFGRAAEQLKAFCARRYIQAQKQQGADGEVVVYHFAEQAFGDHAEVSQADITRYIEEQFPAA